MFKYLGNKLRQLFKDKVDEEQIDQMEELFYQADLGAQTSSQLVDSVRALYHKHPHLTQQEVLEQIKKDLESHLHIHSLRTAQNTPHVILIVGVNGNGKTTTVAKLAKYYQQQGKSVLIAAADTFRAAAVDQLEIWAKRLGVDLVKGKPGADPAAVAFDAITAAKSRGKEIVLIDTAGRLHTKNDLMQELEKIARVCRKAAVDAPHETFLILDATIGQNGIEQALMFHRFTPLTGLILTKLDGSAKGGTVIAIQKQLNLPVHFIGTGEGVDDLQRFDAKSFVQQLLT